MLYYFRFGTAADLADQNLQISTIPSSWQYSAQKIDDRISLTMLFDGYRKLTDQSFLESRDLADLLRFLPGVAVQKPLSTRGMADLYRIIPDFLNHLIESPIEPLKPSSSGNDLHPCYVLDDYLSGLLQDQDRSQLYFRDPMLQHISICRQFLFFLDRSNVFDLEL